MNSPRPHATRAIALVIVLAMLVLLSGLVVAYLSFTTTERNAANESRNQYDARQAGESAVNLVISQIREATKQDGAKDNPVSWASQPGMIRTYAGSSANNEVFKLYSAEVLKQKETDYNPDTEIPTGFLASGDLPKGWVDINDPIVRAATNSTAAEPTYEAMYPIVDPTVKYPYTQTGVVGPDGENTGSFDTKKAPDTKSSAVKGFFCKDFPDPKKRKDKAGNILRVLPLPVRWVYLLRDGSYATMKADGKTINNATADNPIVARIAFWTDDESGKLNINTAAEGRFWDTPMVASKQESGDITGTTITDPGLSANLSTSQPAKGEFQRYPGHPATTCLSPAVRWLFPTYKADGTASGVYKSATPPDLDADWGFREAIYRLAPRVTNGTGTTRGGSKPILNTSTETVVLDHSHLYSTLDEYFFRGDRTGRNLKPISPAIGVEGEVAVPSLDPAAIDKLRFFLTPHSRAPELNLFGLPRVSIWPVNFDHKLRTAFDETFAFSASIKKKEFMFQRNNPNSATYDYDQIERNRQIFKYLQEMTDRSIPWLPGKNFATKFGGNKLNRDQLLTEILDYIRCANLVDTTLTSGTGTYKGGFTPFFWPDSTKPETQMPRTNSGQVVPLRITQGGGGTVTQGFGRFVTPSEVGLLFFGVTTQADGSPIPAGSKGMRAVMLLDMYTVAPGYSGIRENYGIRIVQTPPPGGGGGVRGFIVKIGDTSTPLGFPLDGFNIVNVDAYSAPIGRMFMPFRSFHNQFMFDKTELPITRGWNTFPKTFPKGLVENNDKRDIYPFVSNVIVYKQADAAKGFGISNGFLEIKIYPPNDIPNSDPDLKKDAVSPYAGGANDSFVQKININFPPITTLPFPTSTDFALRLSTGTNGNRTNLDSNSASSGYRWIQEGDVIRSVELNGPTKGDQRMAAARIEVPASFWDKRGGTAFDSATIKRVHGFRVSRSGYMPIADKQDVADGLLVAGQPYRTERAPKVPNGVKGVTMSVSANGGNFQNTLGDWDRGMSKFVDGAFINKPDEGTMNFDLNAGGGLKLPYWLGFSGYEELHPIHYSPNRIMPSPVMFGSLPTTVYGDDSAIEPWRTLLFRPATATGAGSHPGMIDPADHYILDLFQMPVVEPYSISEPFSTAGKININYIAAPFGYWKAGASATAADAYLTRRTGVQGLIRSTKVMVIPKGYGEAGHHENPLDANDKVRYSIDEEKTLDEMHTRLVKGLFKSASEICEVNLQAVGINKIDPNFWTQQPLPGDNGRERPYAHIYPRVTTKSNVYTVHLRAQAVQKNKTVPPNEWDESKDQVVGEYRSSVTLERFLDPNDKALDGFNELTSGSLDPFYRYRIIQARQY